MKKLRFTFLGLVLAAAASFALSCGLSSVPSSFRSSKGQLLSITLTPVTADAQDYPNGQVQFIATGHYKTAPHTVSPLSAGWGTCYQDAPTTEVSVTPTGLAECESGAVGTYTIWANDFPFPGIACNAVTACGGGCMVVGTAQLTCP